ncbi:hypothetical protein J4G78_11090 [Parasphingorhabdus cellanae]|uniref:Uncharacterized protein n=2 Tax=Parasphingorhabdus cellanae TaxID=2806553 RepID=A0ABX7T9C6_9SPHN|nr:hypothetical protein J4G78_11090 [Parasphingorhabdus cellanae]
MNEHLGDAEYSGLLVRDDGGFALQSDDGRRYRLELLRTPIDEVEKRVIVTGRLIYDDQIEAEGVRLADGG